MKSKVTLEYCPSYSLPQLKEALIRVIDPLGGWCRIVQPGDSVLLKPNFVFAKPAELAVTTHPIFIQAVAEMVLDCRAKPLIGDSPPIHSAKKVIHASGLSDIVKRLGIEIVEFSQPTAIRRHEAVYTQGIASPKIDSSLIEADTIINLPKLKAHRQMLLTAAVKNIYGCVVGRRKPYWHFKLQRNPDDFAAMLLANYEKVAPEYTLVDAIIGMERDGPIGGIPKPIGLVIGGSDCVAIDRIVTELLGVSPDDHFVIRTAQQLGFPGAALDNIQVYGYPLDYAILDSFELPELIPIGFSVSHLVKGFLKKILHKHRKGSLAPAS